MICGALGGKEMFKRLKSKIDDKLEDPEFAEFSSSLAIGISLTGLIIEVVLMYLK